MSKVLLAAALGVAFGVLLQVLRLTYQMGQLTEACRHIVSAVKELEALSSLEVTDQTKASRSHPSQPEEDKDESE